MVICRTWRGWAAPAHAAAFTALLKDKEYAGIRGRAIRLLCRTGRVPGIAA
ncbi:MAG: hypothetical protein ACYC6L_14380 [Anaerolineae bacterium]